VGSEQALLAVVQQAYVCGVSTRRVDQLVESLGLLISKSEVSGVCQALDDHVDAFRTRPLEGRYPYRFLDAKIEKVRDGGRVVNKALVIAHGVHETGRREILSIDVGEAETEAFWTGFLRGLVKRGLVGVQLAISDAHAGLKPRSIGRRLRLAALHGALPPRLFRTCPQGPARPAGGADPPDLCRRRVEQARDRSPRPSPVSTTEGAFCACRLEERPTRSTRSPYALGLMVCSVPWERGQARAAASMEAEGSMSGRRTIRNEANSPNRPARIGTSSAT
jgi:hypothetical protein